MENCFFSDPCFQLPRKGFIIAQQLYRIYMKVTAINGSPNAAGNTAYALNQAGLSLREEGIDFEMIHVGNKPVHGCTGCCRCFEKRDGRCVFADDIVNEVLPVLKASDGIILGSPVYYSGIAGAMKSFLDRTFFVSGANGNYFRHKVGASVAAVRRSGGTMTFNSLNMYLSISEMLIASSNYWNVIHGNEPAEAAEDTEGVQVMHVLGKNIAWMLKMKEATKELVAEPEATGKIFTNFIR
ncbi:Cd1 [Bacteroidales bacterium Barb6]|nr:Cd1 [Bacteroidales bacterium Barb6]